MIYPCGRKSIVEGPRLSSSRSLEARQVSGEIIQKLLSSDMVVLHVLRIALATIE